MKEKWKLKRLRWRDDLIRGDLVYVKLPQQIETSVQSGIRPCIIVSNAICNRNAKIVNVCPLTSKSEKGNNPVHIHIGKNEKGVYIDKDSWILIEQLQTIDKKSILSLVGHLENNSDAMQSINLALIKQLNLGEHCFGLFETYNGEIKVPE